METTSADIDTLNASIPVPAEGKELSKKEKEEVEKIQKEIATKTEDLAFFKQALLGEHEIDFGMRPEDILDADDEEVSAKKIAEPFEVTVSVAELLGHEYYVHSDFGGIDMVAKIPLSHEIKGGDVMHLGFVLSKSHIFDSRTEKRIF